MGRVTVRVVPRSSRDEVSVEAGRAVIRVRAVADRGAANEAAGRALAAALGVAPTRVSLTRGSRSRIKIFDVEGLDPEDVLDRLSAL
jgi:uncharacterized protein